MSKNNISLNGLRAFEVASRHLSFTLAAKELNITQAAISQQVRRLEDQIGVDLFLRKTRGLALSPSGSDLAITVRAAISDIQQTIDQISGSETKNVLTVSMLASFASRWLIPRLFLFQEKHPDIELHIHTSNHTVDFMTSGIDAAIRLVDIEHSVLGLNRSGLCSEFMMPDALCLVATPFLGKAVGKDISNIYKQKLFIDGSRLHGSDLYDITALATQGALASLNIDKTKLKIIEFDQSDDVMLAAIAGQGIAFTRLSLCADDLEAGRLQIILDYCKPLNYGYSLVYPQKNTEDIQLKTFKRWLNSETGVFRQRLSRSQSNIPP